jgi:hypothetical protein
VLDLPVETIRSPLVILDINQKLTLPEFVVAAMVNRGSDGDHKNDDYRRGMLIARHAKAILHGHRYSRTDATNSSNPHEGTRQMSQRASPLPRSFTETALPVVPPPSIPAGP